MKFLFYVFIITFGLTSSKAQVGIGTQTPDDSAILEVESSDKGFLPPRMSTSERDEINNPADGLTIFNIDDNCVQFFNGTGWFNVCDGSLVGPPIVSGACAGEPTIFTFDGLEYRPVESSNNRCWLDRNLGSSQVATSIADEDSYGDLYQWGRTSDGHENRTSLTSPGPVSAGDEGSDFITVDSSPNNWLSIQDNSRWGASDDEDKGVHDPCPSGFRVPSEAEWNAERIEWDDNDRSGAFASPLKLPTAGFRNRDDGSLENLGVEGRYWSSSLLTTNGRLLLLTNTSAVVASFTRATGFSVRCIKE